MLATLLHCKTKAEFRRLALDRLTYRLDSQFLSGASGGPEGFVFLREFLSPTCGFMRSYS